MKPNISMISRAIELAAEAHKGQTYVIGDKTYSYFDGHLERVVYEMNWIIIACPHLKPAARILEAACWLHDTLEDTAVTADEINAACGIDVLNLVAAVTDVAGTSRSLRKHATYPRIRAAGELAVAVKLADRIANVKAADVGSKFLNMYRAEHGAFEVALRAPGELEPVWKALAFWLGQ